MVPRICPRATCHPRITATARPPSRWRRTTRSSGNPAPSCAAISQVRSALSSSTTITSYRPGRAWSRVWRTAARKSAIFSLSFRVGTTSESTGCASPGATAGTIGGTINGPVGAAIVFAAACPLVFPGSLLRGATANRRSPCQDDSTVTRVKLVLVYTSPTRRRRSLPI